MLRPWLLGLCISVGVAGCTTTGGHRSFVYIDAPTTGSASHSCLRKTGTHIRLREGTCSIANGRSYSRDDIAGTGASTTAAALAALDLSVHISQ